MVEQTVGGAGLAPASTGGGNTRRRLVPQFLQHPPSAAIQASIAEVDQPTNGSWTASRVRPAGCLARRERTVDPVNGRSHSNMRRNSRSVPTHCNAARRRAGRPLGSCRAISAREGGSASCTASRIVSTSALTQRPPPPACQQSPHPSQLVPIGCDGDAFHQLCHAVSGPSHATQCRDVGVNNGMAQGRLGRRRPGL
jgi:hypothetical protein